jgi:TonB family protein
MDCALAIQDVEFGASGGIMMKPDLVESLQQSRDVHSRTNDGYISLAERTSVPAGDSGRPRLGFAPLRGILASIALLLLPCASGESVTPDEDFVPCQVHQRVPVRFPPRLLDEGILQGEARLLLDVNSSGELADVLVIGYTRREFADAALEAVTQWRFTPARVAGEAASSTITLNIRFNTAGVHAYVKPPFRSDEPEVSAGQQFVYGPAGVAALDAVPAAIRRPRPMYLREWIEEGRTGTVTVQFYIDDTGRVRFPTIVGPADEYLGAAALDAVKRWLFRPPTVQGRPVLTRVQQVFGFHPRSPEEPDPSP